MNHIILKIYRFKNQPQGLNLGSYEQVNVFNYASNNDIHVNGLGSINCWIFVGNIYTLQIHLKNADSIINIAHLDKSKINKH